MADNSRSVGKRLMPRRVAMELDVAQRYKLSTTHSGKAPPAVWWGWMTKAMAATFWALAPIHAFIRKNLIITSRQVGTYISTVLQSWGIRTAKWISKSDSEFGSVMAKTSPSSR